MSTNYIKHLSPYLFLAGSCLTWYGTSSIHQEIFLLLIPVPFLLFFHYGRLVTILLTGLLYAEYTAIQQQHWQLSESQVKENHLITGKIVELPSYQLNGVRLHIKLLSINHQQLMASQSVNIRLGCYEDCPSFEVNQIWRLLVRLKPANGYLNPGGFDYEKWLYSEQVKATGYLVPSKQNQLLESQTGIDNLRARLRSYLIDKLQDPDVSASAIALILGDKSYLGRQQKQMLADNGLSHLMAISGLHIGLAAIPGYLFAGLLWMRLKFLRQFNKVHFQWLFALVPVVFYTGLSGFGLPACRALIMLLVFALVQVTRDSVSSHSRFCLALWIILLLQPLAPLQASFWLSFAATAILIFLGSLHRPTNPVANLFLLQSQLFILLMPIQLLIFGKASLIGPFINFIAIPFVSLLLLPLLLFVTLLILIPMTLSFIETVPGTELILYLVEYLLEWFWRALSLLSAVTESLQFSIRDFNLSYLFLYPLLLLLLLPVSLKLKGLILLVVSLIQSNYRVNDQVRLVVLDVGQGLAVTVEYQDKLLLYDTAYGFADYAVAQNTLLPWLNSLSREEISLFVVSHNDADHSGGMSQIMNKLKIRDMVRGPDVIIPANLETQPDSISICNKPMQWQWDAMQIRLLSPMSVQKGFDQGNNSSCVLSIEFSGVKLLLTGDIEKAAETRLLSAYPELTSDIILMPHHGSKTSSGWSFIEQLAPAIAIASTGYMNRFNLPADNVINRYQRRDVSIYNTASSGAVEIIINQHGRLAIHQWRLDNPTLWRRD